MFANNSFYGGQKGRDFNLAKIFSNASELKADLDNGFSSDVAIGDFVMVAYGLKQTNITLTSDSGDTIKLTYCGNGKFKDAKGEYYKYNKDLGWINCSNNNEILGFLSSVSSDSSRSSYYDNYKKDKSFSNTNYNSTLWQKGFFEEDQTNTILIHSSAANNLAYKLVSSFDNDFENSLIIKDSQNFYTWGTASTTNNYGVPNTLGAVSNKLKSIYGDAAEAICSDEIIAVNHFTTRLKQIIYQANNYSVSLIQNHTEEDFIECYISDDFDLSEIDYTEFSYAPIITSTISINFGATFGGAYKTGDGKIIEKWIIPEKNLFMDLSINPIEISNNGNVIQTIYIVENNGVFTIEVLYGEDKSHSLEKEDEIYCYSYWYFKDAEGDWGRVQINANMLLQQEYTNIEAASKAYSSKYINELEKSLRGKEIFTLDLKKLFDNNKLGYKILYSEYDSRNEIKGLNHFRICHYDIGKNSEHKAIYNLLSRFNYTKQELNNTVSISYASSIEEINKEIVSITLHKLSDAYRVSIIYWQPDNDNDISGNEQRQLKSGILTIMM